MKSFQSLFTDKQWTTPLPTNSGAQLVLAFGSRDLLADKAINQQLQTAFPQADIMGCTTSGEIADTLIYDDSLCVTAITWEYTKQVMVSCNVEEASDSQQTGLQLASQLPSEGLKHVLILSDGQRANGTLLAEGLKGSLPHGVIITGGLAGDGDRFQQTWVRHNDRLESGLVVACGFYGDAVRVGHGCMGGWDTFGPDRLITRARDNVLYELDGTSALDLYKNYLGEYSKDLPGSALLFPLHVHQEIDQPGVVRTILSIDEENRSMIFAGDIPEGAYAQLMHANFDRLIDGAYSAAENCLSSFQNHPASVAILISCVGRRIVLKQRTEEELEAVQEVLSDNTTLCGFYSYGEISPLVSGIGCTLHNQTMTITALAEVVNA